MPPDLDLVEYSPERGFTGLTAWKSSGAVWGTTDLLPSDWDLPEYSLAWGLPGRVQSLGVCGSHAAKLGSVRELIQMGVHTMGVIWGF